MTADRADAAVALNRFGLGARPGDLDAVAAEPGRWLRLQTVEPDPLGPLPLAASSGEHVAAFLAARQRGTAAVTLELRGRMRRTYRWDAAVRTLYGAATAMGYRERLARFWSNHFTVSAVRPVITGLVVPFEAEAIRPALTGSFGDLLVAAIRHPAMLLYLDNAGSVGPSSRLGRRRGRGLNENLAREILELHTLGVDGGYSQADVEALARLLTGWTVSPEVGGFRFLAPAHEPGPKTLLGRRYGDGEAEGERAIRDLARHPATARHIATKLVRHIVDDTPPTGAIERVRDVFLATDGHLPSVHAALIDLPQAWVPQQRKYKTPDELVLSALRSAAPIPNPVAEAETVGRAALLSLDELGQPPFRAPSPAGWPDREAGWLGAEGMMRRVRWAQAFAHTLAGRGTAGPEPGPAMASDRFRLVRAAPSATAEAVLGPRLSPSTRFQIGGAPRFEEGLALLLLAPEFQRR